MQKGHMHQHQQGIRSTKVIDEDKQLEFGAYKPVPGVKRKDVTKREMYWDQTGRFPITSSCGHRYFMVAIEMDGNHIDAELMKARTTKELISVYQKIFDQWKGTGVISPNWHILDNEAPEDFKNAIRANICRVKLVPPDMHCRNTAEQAIQTFKGHFISILSGVANDFPIQQLHKLTQQAVLTLNILHSLNVAPNVSMHIYHRRQFDYNQNPLAPLGCRVQFHSKPTKCWSWGKHSCDGWYMGASEEHYRCDKIFVKVTRAIWVTDMVFFKHQYITQPKVTQADAIINA